MACAHPFKMLPSVSVNGRWHSWTEPINAPCYRCVNCIRDRQNFIIDRANYEYCRRLTAAFVTFTYDNAHLISECAVRDKHGFIYDSNSRGDIVPRTTLRYDHLRKFIDSIRVYIKRHPEIQGVMCQPDFSYMYCGEYGSDKYPDLLGRCHFHVIFFGLDFAYCKKFIFERWKYGFIDCLPLLDGGIRYVTKYMSQFDLGKYAFYKYDVKGIARPRLCLSINFGKGLLMDNVDNIYENYFTYPISKGKRRPISAYWKRLITGGTVLRDPTKSAWNKKSPEYNAYCMINTAQQMLAQKYHAKNYYSKASQTEYKAYKARILEMNLIADSHNRGVPVPDIDKCFQSKFGWLTWYGRRVRRLPSASQRLLADEYNQRLYERYLYLKFPEVSYGKGKSVFCS